MTAWNSYCLAEGDDLAGVEARLAEAFTLADDGEQERIQRFYDSFDWRLRARGCLLCAEGRVWTLLADDGAGPVPEEDGAGPRPGKRHFCSEFQAGSFRKKLCSALEMRAVLPVAAVRSHARKLRALNRDDKTVARVWLETLQAEGAEERLLLVHLCGVRGYGRELRRLQKQLGQAVTVSPAGYDLRLQLGLLAADRRPGDYSSKFQLQLHPEQTAAEAMTAIYLDLLSTIRRNLDGVKQDLDSEFLHDLRVAVRRTRSGLTLVKKVLPDEMVERFRQEFAYVGAITGPTRDLDVYLLAEEDYHQRLPDALQGGLQAFFSDLAGRRQRAWRQLVRDLDSPRFAALLQEWREALEKPGGGKAPLADLPVVDLARRVIHKRYMRVMRDGLAITEATPDSEVHRLRIQGKKLRYAIEFFSTLFPEKEVQQLIKHLKKLQNNLGEFNDLAVQQEMLDGYLRDIHPGAKSRLMLGAAIGGLMTSLHHQQLEVRREFAAAFADFAGAKTTKLFHRLFGPQEES